MSGGQESLLVSAYLSVGLGFVAIALFILVAITDYQTRKIPNVLVAAGLVLYVLWTFVTPGTDPLTDLAVGAGLFALGFLGWLLRALGAGDAKFMLVCGLFSGLDRLPMFAIWLAALGLMVLIIVMIGRRVDISFLLARFGLRAVEEAGKIPYGVPLALATTAAFLDRLQPIIASAA